MTPAADARTLSRRKEVRPLAPASCGRLGDKQAAIDIAEQATRIAPGDAEGISLLAALYADQGDMDQAIRLARQGVENNPGRAASHLLLAQLLDKAERVDEAIASLETIIALKPDELAHRKRLAAYHNQKGQSDEARAVLEQAVADFPDSNEAKLTLVALLKEQGEVDAAEQALRGFVGQDAENHALRIALAGLLVERDQNDEAKRVLTRVIEASARIDEQAQARTKLAALLLTEQQAQQALEQVEAVLEADPKNTEALLIRGAIALSKEDPDRGIADLRTLLREDPGHVRALRLKARGHLTKGELALARQSLEAAVEAQPQEMGANIELAQLLVQSGDHADALTVLEKMRRFSPDNLLVLSVIGKLHINQEDWDQLEPVAADLLRTHPERALGDYYRGLVLQGSDRPAESIAAFEAALAKEPNAAEPLIGLARSQLALGRPAEALERVRLVSAQTPQNFLARNLEGEILLTQQDYRGAEKAFEAASQVNPQWAKPYRNLARVAVIEGDDARVVAVLRKGYDNTDSAALGVDLAAAMDRVGQRDEAIALYEEILANNPEMLSAANNLAMLLVNGNPDQATLDRALALTKRFALQANPTFLDTLGWVHFKRGELDRALPLLERAARTDDRLAEIDYHLAEVYAALGRRDEAVAILEQVQANNQRFAGDERVTELLTQLKEG